MSKRIFLLLWLVLAGQSTVYATETAEDHAIAIECVKAFGSDIAFKHMFITMAKNSPIIKALSDKYGERNVNIMLARKTNEVLPQHIDNLNNMLAKAYLQHLTKKEILSLTAYTKHSPYFKHFTELQATIATDAIGYSPLYIQELSKHIILVTLNEYNY